MTDESAKLILRFRNPDRKRELVEAAAREGMPLVHFVMECYREWLHQRELERAGDERALLG